MDSKEFHSYQEKTIQRFKDILGSHPQGFCDEQGLPSYTNPNPLMRWLTWKRVEVLLSEINSQNLEKGRALDFGCGYGVFLTYLNQSVKHTIAFDLNILELKKMGMKLGWNRISFLDDFSKLASMKKSFDLVLASEVLEHVENLENTIKIFSDLLTDEGVLLVSGPTENILYQIGRKLAGYSGEYHVRNIYHIKEVLARYFDIKVVGIIIPVFTFYEVYLCRKLRN
jgi:2-polyprenyl-3-methyl-5-hydroxy-6-metoxy-1,4-benzoquinol methylase